jgi:hypothetical protein
MLLFFLFQPGRILQARQNFASPNFCLGSRERLGAEQNQIPEFPYAYRALNDIISILSSPIGNIKDNLARLSRSTIFPGIDSIGAFHVIELEDKDKAKLAFATPWGSYQFVQMPFGLAGGHSSYARLVHMVLDGIPYTQALPYLDDTVIHSKDLAGHFEALDRVLRAYKKAGLKLQPAKCQLFQRSIEYLGHMVSAEGIAPVPGYVQVVKD